MTLSRLFLILLVVYSPLFAQGQSTTMPEDSTLSTTLIFGGYAKLDWLLSRFRDGEPELESPIRDIHLPGGIPVGEDLQGFDSQIHAKESRFNFEVQSQVLGSPIRMFMELDFLLSAAGDERVSNSYNPRLRHFFFEWKNFLFGQTWTNFMTVASIPDGIIFVGGPEGLIFNRQAQLRYKLKGWTFSVENPETTIRPYLGEGFTTSSGGPPDITVKHTFKGDWGIIGVSGIYRTLRSSNDEGDRFYSRAGGLNASGLVNVGNSGDNLRLSLTYGQGLGRYQSFAFVTAAVAGPTDQIEDIGTTSVLISYLHHWNSKWRSTATWAFLGAEDNSDLTGGTANRYAWSGSASLLYAPHPRLLFGVQGLYAHRELENGINGAMGRLQFSARYIFDFSVTIQHKDKATSQR